MAEPISDAPYRPTYSASMSEGSGHLKGFARSTVGAHPVAASAIMAGLLLAVLALAIHAYSNSRKKAGFGGPAVWGHHSKWYHGSMDAGNGGPVHREATHRNMAALLPELRAGASYTPHMKEGLASGPGGVAPACHPGDHLVQYQNPDGAVLSRCVRNGSGPPANCNNTEWALGAQMEAAALGTVGSFPHTHWGEGNLRSAVDAAADGTVGMSDDDLADVMHHGGSP